MYKECPMFLSYCIYYNESAVDVDASSLVFFTFYSSSSML